MSEEAIMSPRPLIVGCRERLTADATVVVWRPLAKTELAGLPALPPAPPRPRPFFEEDAREAARAARSEPSPGEDSPGERSAATRQARTRPAWLEEGTVQELIWQRPEDAAQLIRSTAHEDALSTPDEGGRSNLDRVAALLVAIGEELSVEVMNHLSSVEAEQIAAAIAAMDVVSVETQKGVLSRFEEHLRSREWARTGGSEFARRTLEGAYGSQDALQIMERVGRTSKGFHFLRNVSPELVAPTLALEHPQTVALVLSQVDPGVAAGIMGELSRELQAEVAQRITAMERTSPAMLQVLEDALEQIWGNTLTSDRDVGGPRVLAEILNRGGKQMAQHVLEQMDGKTPEAAATVRRSMEPESERTA